MADKNLKIDHIRKDYVKHSLDKGDLNDDPIAQFKKWFQDALDSGVLEPTVMSLSTVDPQGEPSSRIVLLKDVDNEGFTFYTNHESDKGNDIEYNPNVALLFFWGELERQVRIKGVAEKVDSHTATEYFQSRPKGSQIGAWASDQSKIIPNREVLQERVASLEARYQNDDVLPKPDSWGGYLIRSNELEFWQGRSSRLHDRFRYTKSQEGVWLIDRLSP